MSSVVLLTGATGFLGTQIARWLLTNTGVSIVALVRAEDREAAALRLSRAWWDWPDLAQAVGGRVRVVHGDVSEVRLGLDEVEYEELARTVTHVIHAAADVRLNAPIDELRKANVRGTANVLEFARTAHRDHGLARFSHVSTAYVAGGRRGTVPEDSLTDEYGFCSAYELSKYEGERLVQKANADLPISVFRPGLVVGDSRNGAIKTFNTIYVPLRLYLNGRLKVLPASRSMRINLVPVDYVAEAVARLTFEPRAEGKNFHLTAPWEKLPTAQEFVEFVRRWAQEHLDIRLPRPLFLPIPAAVSRSCYRTQRVVQRRGRGFLDALITLAPYFNERRRFQRDNVDTLLGAFDFRWREVLPPLLEFAVSHGFLHRSNRTVHEQVLFRIRSKSIPVTYHDVVEGKIVTRDAEEVRDEILAAAEALRSMGVGKSDHVALVGLNSSRYLTVDVAIGLAGATSVPLYYTSPPAEIDEILASSGARLLFVGAPWVLERLGELRADIPAVSFCRRAPEKLPACRIIPWEEFLAMGEGSKGSVNAQVGFGDFATVRYTSGTTGRAKGVCFDHENLRWMAESLCSVLPWKARNAPVSYLSFLPMNHVVEGILAMYSPYYTPAPVHIYFLEDFHDLQRTLRQVRPTVFFSVPRFYEKLWDALLKSRLGRGYVKTNEGTARRILRWIVRRAVLRRAGLDRCAQMIVGSAASSERLLHDLQELSIEVHNAYGLTEAPLVTLNRVGANRVATVGEPLPRTEVRIADDDEVMVRGPQVARGYLDQGIVQPFRDGWLPTGDLGHITGEGILVIRGRKKDLVKTSYAKYIHPAKIESMLRGIYSVDEAMIVGEGRPFCGAILWVNSKGYGADLVASIERAIVEVNQRLSHPEQVKRWAIMNNDLSIEHGDLTPNLKLKRSNVMPRLSDVVDALYEGSSFASDGVIHIGGVEREG